jgi:hypothetical protein
MAKAPLPRQSKTSILPGQEPNSQKRSGYIIATNDNTDLRSEKWVINQVAALYPDRLLPGGHQTLSLGAPVLTQTAYKYPARLRKSAVRASFPSPFLGLSLSDSQRWSVW